MRTVRKPTLSEKEIMRINRKKLTLIIASLCGTGSSAIALGQDYSNPTTLSSVGRIGDGGGPTPARAPQHAMTPDARSATFRNNVADDATDGTVESNGSYYDPAIESTSYTQMVGGAHSNCSPRGTSSFGSGSCGSSVGSTGWLESETLLWWAKGNQNAPLILGGANQSPTATPTIPLAGGANNPVGTDLLVGMRLNVGKWLDCNQNFGVGARAWGIVSDGTNENISNGAGSTAVSFFSTSVLGNFPGPALFNVNESQPPFGSNTGTIQLRNDLDLVAGELYGRALLARQGTSRVDFLAGYTFVRLDSELGLTTRVADGITGNGVANGTVTTVNDSFGTQNQFHGGHMGLMHEISKGRFTFTALGKVAIGNMEQSSTINGQTSVVSNNQTTNTARGLFAQGRNSGILTRNQFTFLPEAGAKMKYQLGRAQFGVGYTLLLFPSVAMAGDQVNNNIDQVTGFAGGLVNSPIPSMNSNTFFLHGLDLGLTFKF